MELYTNKLFFMGYSSQQDCKGILGDSGAQLHGKLSLESSSSVLGDCNSISFIFLKFLETAGGMAVTAQRSYLPEPPACAAL